MRLPLQNSASTKRIFPVLALLSFTLAGCSTVYVPSFIKVYQPDIAQGNILEPEQVAKLHVGMSSSEVQQILGTPALMDIFHQNRRETYVFYDKRGKRKAFQHTLIILYDADGRVAKIEQDGAPLSQAPAQDLPESLRYGKGKGKPPAGSAVNEKVSPEPSPYSLTPPAQPTGGLGVGNSLTPNDSAVAP